MKKLLAIALLFPFYLFSQQNDTIITDTSVIVTDYFKNTNKIFIENLIKGNNIKYQNIYNYTTRNLIEERIYDENVGIGIWKYYDSECKLLKTINYNSGEIKYYYDNNFEIVKKLGSLKNKADSLLIVHFGEKFFTNKIRINYCNSAYYDYKKFYDWEYDEKEIYPNEYLLRYFIVFDKQHNFETIEISLDSLGQFICTNEYDKPKGIQNCKTYNYPSDFAINYEESIILAKNNGLNLDSQFIYYFRWIPPKGELEIEGEYEIVIAELKERKEEKSTDLLKILEKFDAVIINPFDGKVKEKKEMSRWASIHKDGAYYSELK